MFIAAFFHGGYLSELISAYRSRRLIIDLLTDQQYLESKIGRCMS